MTRERAEEIMARLKRFHMLERKATTEAGWIALAYSVPIPTAESWIDQAQEILAREPKP